MGGVEDAIKKGLFKVKESITAFINELRPNASSQGLLPLMDIPTTFAFNWPTIQRALRPAVNLTAAHHYQDWYKGAFCGSKCTHADIQKYQLEDNPSDNPSPRPLEELDPPSTQPHCSAHTVTHSQKAQKLN